MNFYRTTSTFYTSFPIMERIEPIFADSDAKTVMN